MLKLKTVNDLIELAIQREQESVDMYLELASRINNPKVNAILRDRAEEELEHKQILELELLKLGQVIPLTNFHMDETVLENFKKSSGGLIDIEIEDILALSVQKEDAAFKFYFNLASKNPNKEMKNVFIALAEQEMRHKFAAEIELEKYMTSGEYRNRNLNDDS